ncbi:signal peptidase II, partial [Staphylococcus capitis]
MRHTRGGPSGLSSAGTPAASKQHHPGSTRRPRIVLVVGALLLAGADLGVKAAAVAGLSGGATVDLGLLNLRLHYNPGVAFSLGAAFPSWVIIAATGLIIAGLTWYLLSTA